MFVSEFIVNICRLKFLPDQILKVENKIEPEAWNMEHNDGCQRGRGRGAWMKGDAGIN